MSSQANSHVRDIPINPIVLNFFNVLFPSSVLTGENKIEIRLISNRTQGSRGSPNNPLQYWTTTPEGAAKVVAHLNSIEAKRGLYNIYFGVAPRQGETCDKDDIPYITSVWLDFDLWKVGQPEYSKRTKMKAVKTKEEALQRINDFYYPPTMIVDSGHGFHVYWKLHCPMKLPTVTKDSTEDEKLGITHQRKILQAKIKAFQDQFGGDSTSDFSRIFRVPTSLNVKYEEAVECKLIVYEPTREYVFEELISMITPEIIQKTIQLDLSNENSIDLSIYTTGPNRVTDLNSILNPAFIHPDIIEAARVSKIDVASGQEEVSATDRALVASVQRGFKKAQPTIDSEVHRDRSANDYYVAVRLYDEGLNDAEVFSCFQIFREQGWFAGEKASIRATVSAHDYLTVQTLPSAKAVSIAPIFEQIHKTPFVEDILTLIQEKAFFLKSKTDRLVKRFCRTVAALFPAVAELKAEKLEKLIKTHGRLNPAEEGRFFSLEYGGLIVNIEALRDYLETNYHILCLNEIVFIYKNGVYTADKGNQELTFILDKLLSPNLLQISKTRSLKDVIKLILPKFSKFSSEAEISRTEYYYLINVKNGMYDTRTDQLIAHDPKYMSMNQLNVIYDKNAADPAIFKFMRDVFKTEVETVWRYQAYCLTPDVVFQNFLLLYGRGKNGKSVFMNFLDQTLGRENCSHESLQDLSKNFTTANLYGKIANICSDISESTVATHRAKQLTGNDVLSADRKYLGFLEFINRARPVFSCNELPRTSEVDEAYFNRVIIIKCDTDFTNNLNVKIDETLNTESVRSTWFNKIIQTCKELRATQSLAETELVEKLRREYKQKSDSVSLFFANATVETREVHINIPDTYHLYVAWCQKKKYLACSEGTFLERSQHKLTNIATNIKSAREISEAAVFLHRDFKEEFKKANERLFLELSAQKVTSLSIVKSTTSTTSKTEPTSITEALKQKTEIIETGRG